MRPEADLNQVIETEGDLGGSPESWSWPKLTEPELVKRLAMDEAEFVDYWLAMIRRYPPRQYTRDLFTLGTGYPWPRPSSSFVLEEGSGRPLAEMDSESRAMVIEQLTGPGSGRTPMLAIGSNASPQGLWQKFGHFEYPEDRTLLAVSGELHDFDVVATAEFAHYGAMPATLAPSPGTRVATMTIWVTDTQLTQLAWAEIPYWMGRLRSRFSPEPAVTELGFSDLESSLVFVNRFGAFAPEGDPFALAAIRAEDRVFSALTQVELLGKAAALTFGAGTSAEELVRRAFEDPVKTGPLVTEVMRSNSLAFESDRWTPFSA